MGNLKMNDAETFGEILVLETRELVRSVRAAHVDFEGRHANGAVRVGEEVVQDVKDGRLRHNQLLQVLRVEIVAVDVDG